MKKARSISGIALVLLTAACSTLEPTSPITGEPSVRAAKPTGTTSIRARYTLADVVAGAPTGIRGDGRLANGSVSGGSESNEYQGDFCGVHAMLENQSARFDTDPDMRWSSTMAAACGTPRSFAFYLQGVEAAPTMIAPQTMVDDLASLAVGQVGTRAAVFGVQLPNCSSIRFNSAYAGSSNVSVTRLADVSTSSGPARSWIIESQGSHAGACVVTVKNKLVATGATYYLPFSIAVTEVPAPSPVFP